MSNLSPMYTNCTIYILYLSEVNTFWLIVVVIIRPDFWSRSWVVLNVTIFSFADLIFQLYHFSIISAFIMFFYLDFFVSNFYTRYIYLVERLYPFSNWTSIPQWMFHIQPRSNVGFIPILFSSILSFLDLTLQ